MTANRNLELLEQLARAARELIEAVVHTEVDDEDLSACVRSVRELTVALEQRRRGRPAIAVEVPGGGVPFLITNPVDGPLNPLAPPLTAIENGAGRYRGGVRFGGAHEGPPGLVHGGWSAMILDHALARACLSSGERVMTTSIEVRYRAGTPSHADLDVDAAIGPPQDGRLTAVGTIRSGTTVTAEASARFAIVGR